MTNVSEGAKRDPGPGGVESMRTSYHDSGPGGGDAPLLGVFGGGGGGGDGELAFD